MNRHERHAKAVEALMDGYHAYGKEPDNEGSFIINTIITTYTGHPLSCQQIAEAMTVCHDIHTRRTSKPDLFYKGHDVEPLDDVYDDALDDYEHDDEAKLYQIIQDASKE